MKGTSLAGLLRDQRYRLIFIVVIAGLHLLFALLPDLLTAFRVGKLDPWFRDTYAMLAASDSSHAGYDPFVENPYDLFGERHIYSDWWYGLGRMGLTRTDYLWVGSVIVLAFWCAVVAVLPLRRRRDLWWAIALCASPPFWLAVNRANPDLLLFALLTISIPVLLDQRRWVRLLAPWPIALATGLKYFPLLGGIVLLHPARSRTEYRLRLLLTSLLLAVLGWSLRDDVANYLNVNWVARGQFIFGAAAIPANYNLRMDIYLMVGRVIGLAIVFGSIVVPSFATRNFVSAHERNWLLAVLGAAVLAGNFFLTVGYLYKVIFAVWLLPLGMDLLDAGKRVARPARWVLTGLVCAVWLEALVRVSSFMWVPWLQGASAIAIRSGAAIVANVIEWTVMIPLAMLVGFYLKSIFLNSQPLDLHDRPE
jgi:hypothetical protein